MTEEGERFRIVEALETEHYKDSFDDNNNYLPDKSVLSVPFAAFLFLNAPEENVWAWKDIKHAEDEWNQFIKNAPIKQLETFKFNMDFFRDAEKVFLPFVGEKGICDAMKLLDPFQKIRW